MSSSRIMKDLREPLPLPQGKGNYRVFRVVVDLNRLDPSSLATSATE